MANVEDDNDMPQLPADTLAALQEFYGEKDAREKKFEDLKSAAKGDFDKKPLTMEAFTEDWNASQFWYSDETATVLAKQLLEGATDESAIAVVSAPSVFIQLKNLLASGSYSTRPQLALLEFDERFSVFKEFTFYDFEYPARLPGELKGRFDRIIFDPPFLSSDCQTKAALTVRWLSKPEVRLIGCTGERMESLVTKLYAKAGLRTTTFDPKHAKGLSNEFRCYANFQCADWDWRES